MSGSPSWRRIEKSKPLNSDVGMGATWKFGTIVISIKSPEREQQPALEVNWCEVTIKRESDGQLLYRNSWITNHNLTPQRVFLVCAAGRSRWRTENENHNVLKTRGYHLEHNFGHGQQHLSSFLLTLNLLAFLWPTVLHLVDERYQRARIQRGTRRGFFQDVICLTKYLLFESWHHLLDFMLVDAIPRALVNSSWCWIGMYMAKAFYIPYYLLDSEFGIAVHWLITLTKSWSSGRIYPVYLLNRVLNWSVN